MIRVWAILLGLVVGTAQAAPLLQLHYEVDTSYDTDCGGSRCDDVQLDRDDDRFGITGGALYPVGALELGASLDYDYGPGATLRARISITERLRIGAGLGGRWYESDPGPAGLIGAAVGSDRTSTDEQVLPYVDVSLEYAIFFVRWSRIEGDFDHTYHEFTGLDGSGNPTYGPAERFDIDQTQESIWVGLNVPF